MLINKMHQNCNLNSLNNMRHSLILQMLLCVISTCFRYVSLCFYYFSELNDFMFAWAKIINSDVIESTEIE